MYCKLLSWVHSTLHRLKSIWSIPSLCGQPLPKCTEGNIGRDLCLSSWIFQTALRQFYPTKIPCLSHLGKKNKNWLYVNAWLHHILKCVESAGSGSCGGFTGGTSAGIHCGGSSGSVWVGSEHPEHMSGARGGVWCVAVGLWLVLYQNESWQWSL